MKRSIHLSLLLLLLPFAATHAQQPTKPSPAQLTAAAHHRNPIVQTCYTTDPAPLNVGDSVLYVFTGHDEAGADFFWMQEWRVYSTRDMVNWQDHGSPLALESFTWADDRAWRHRWLNVAVSSTGTCAPTPSCRVACHRRGRG